MWTTSFCISFGGIWSAVMTQKVAKNSLMSNRTRSISRKKSPWVVIVGGRFATGQTKVRFSRHAFCTTFEVAISWLLAPYAKRSASPTSKVRYQPGVRSLQLARCLAASSAPEEQHPCSWANEEACIPSRLFAGTGGRSVARFASANPVTALPPFGTG